MRILPFLIFNFLFGNTNAQVDGNTSPTYSELIQTYKKLADEHDEIEFFSMGESDYGLPIYLCVLNGEQDSLFTFGKAKNSTTILVNNGIHPGEPDGINACLTFINNWIEDGKPTKNMPVIGIIPSYNVGGTVNRSSTSRANQEGPEEYGFRGNAQNLDLNRDFIKMDSKNMFVFAKIFHGLDPDVFIDTHVSNGADYQYTLTYIASVKERMAPSMAALVHDEMIPDMGKSLEKRDCDWVPYVNLKAAVPDSGITVFNDLPRYSMGYTSLFHTISFTVETHMLKPFAQRAKATLKFLEECVNWTSKNTVEIETARREAFEYDLNNDYFLFNYQRTDHQDSILFKGFEHSYPISEVTGLPRLKYHRDQPFERYVPYFNVYVAKDSIKVPEFLIVGRQCDEILDRLKANGVEMKTHWDLYYPDLKQWKVESFETWRGPYEGHVGHSNIKVEEAPAFYTMLKDGDVMISLDQRNRRFILNALYPAAPDSYFVWGMMDSYVQQKEHFSSYVFEDIALKLLNNNSDLKKEFEEKKANDSDFAASSRAQLNFIYKRSDYFEPTHNRLPILLRY